MSFEKCRSRAKRKEEREEQEETEAGRELNTSIEAGKKLLRRWDVKQRRNAREEPLREESARSEANFGRSDARSRSGGPCLFSSSHITLTRTEAYCDDDATPEWANLFVSSSSPPSCGDLGGGSEELDTFQCDAITSQTAVPEGGGTVPSLNLAEAKLHRSDRALKIFNLLFF